MNQLYQDEFFGLYLLNKNYINYPILYKAVELQKRLNKKIGDWAVELKYLTHEQVEMIYNEQKRTNNYFGEIAIKKGLLTEEQFEKLMKHQKESHTFIGELLLLMGFITQSQLDKELEEFSKNERARIDKIHAFIKENIKEFEYLDLLLDAAEHTVYRMLLISLKISGNIEQCDKIKKMYEMYKVKFFGDVNFVIYYNFDKMFAADALFNFFNAYPKKKVIKMGSS
ncbi:MAG TPA: hypothetical protein PLM75_12240, partial [bacterium]|nr:hypothetical protein [bacterium]